MLQCLLFFLLASANAISLGKTKCSAELDGVLFESNTYARDYMRRIAANFKTGSALLFTANADSYISAFEQEWGVSIAVNDAPSICTTIAVAGCSSTVSSFSGPVTGPIEIPVTENYKISSFTVALSGASGAGGADVGMGRYNITSPSGTLVVLSNTNICESLVGGPFSFSFADGGVSAMDCSSPNSGIILAPTEPLSL